MARKKDDKPQFVTLRPKGLSRKVREVPGTDIKFVDEKVANSAEYLICIMRTIPLMFPDNHTGTCALCPASIQWAKNAPTKPTRVCVDCLKLLQLPKH